jgi:hypothetical protein
MTLDQTSGSLRSLGERLFDLIEMLTGASPELQGGWYKAALPNGPIFVYLRLIGERATTNPVHSIVLVSQWNDYVKDPRFREGNDFFGRDLSVVARSENPMDLALATEFICRAFWLRSRDGSP